MASEYIPGVCNIGRAEIRMRKVVGWTGLVGTIVLAAALFTAGAEPRWRLTLFAPALLGALGFLQAQMGFCAKYGFGGVFSFGPEVGKTDTVEQAEYRRQDRRKALLIVGSSVLIAAAVSAVAFCVG